MQYQFLEEINAPWSKIPHHQLELYLIKKKKKSWSTKQDFIPSDFLNKYDWELEL